MQSSFYSDKAEWHMHLDDPSSDGEESGHVNEESAMLTSKNPHDSSPSQTKGSTAGAVIELQTRIRLPASAEGADGKVQLTQDEFRSIVNSVLAAASANPASPKPISTFVTEGGATVVTRRDVVGSERLGNSGERTSEVELKITSA